MLQEQTDRYVFRRGIDARHDEDDQTVGAETSAGISKTQNGENNPEKQQSENAKPQKATSG